MVKYSSDIDKVVLRKLRSNFSKVNLIAVLRSSGSLVGNGLVNVSGVRLSSLYWPRRSVMLKRNPVFAVSDFAIRTLIDK